MKLNKVKKLVLMFMLMCCMASQVVMASASTVRDDMAFLNEEPTNDILAPFTNVAEDVLASTVRLVRTIGIAVIFIAVLVAGLGLVVTKESSAKGDKKARLVWIVIGAIVFFAGGAIVIWAGDIGAAVVNSAAVTPTPLP